MAMQARFCGQCGMTIGLDSQTGLCPLCYMSGTVRIGPRCGRCGGGMPPAVTVAQKLSGICHQCELTEFYSRTNRGNQVDTNVREESFQGETVTVVRLTALHNSELQPVVVEGVAKRDEHDENDPVTGLGNKLTGYANARVAMADKARRQEEARKARAKADERKRISAKRSAEGLVSKVAEQDKTIAKLEAELDKWKPVAPRPTVKKAPAKKKAATKR
jgi:hypothetical protein